MSICRVLIVSLKCYRLELMPGSEILTGSRKAGTIVPGTYKRFYLGYSY